MMWAGAKQNAVSGNNGVLCSSALDAEFRPRLRIAMQQINQRATVKHSSGLTIWLKYMANFTNTVEKTFSLLKKRHKTSTGLVVPRHGAFASVSHWFESPHAVERVV